MSFERSRLSLLQNLQDVHKRDIKTYVSGHLNQNKLHKFEEKRHETWASSMQAPVRLKPASHPVHLPVRKGQLCSKHRKQKSMVDTVAEFSFGALGHYDNQDFPKIESKDSTLDMLQSTDLTTTLSCPISLNRDKQGFDVEKSCFVEELKLPEIMFSSQDGQRGCCPGRSKTQPTVSSKHFIKSHLSQVTKEEQFDAMKNFEQTVMSLPDASDKGLLTGDRIVRKLEKRLSKKLQPLNDSSKRGPNFHRLQAYSDCFSKIIEKSTTFSRLLKMIKDEYDCYLAYILDQNRVSQHKTLYSQMPSLNKAKSVSEAIRQQQNVLQTLEEEVGQLLTENDRLRNEVKEQEQKPAAAASEDIPSKVSRTHVEGFPKDFQEQVEDLHSQIADQLETLEKMRKYQRENCVPSSVCQHFEQCIKETEVDIQKLLKQNEFLEQSIEELEEELEMLLSRSGVSEKDSRKLWKKVNVSKVLEYGANQKH